ncbi:MAG: hypothetical protein UU13_C0015G0001, partial [Candidatus Nomurabacteria bacterium GW2011_GWB1_40_7]
QISRYQDFSQNAFGFRRTEGANKLDTNSALCAEACFLVQ